MNIKESWRFSSSSARWELLFKFGDFSGNTKWCHLDSKGTLKELRTSGDATHCIISPDGARALLIGHSHFFEGTFGLRTIVKHILDLRSNALTEVNVVTDCAPCWAHSGLRFSVSKMRSREQDMMENWVLEIHNLLPGSARETEVVPVRCLQWQLDDQALIALVATTRALSLSTFSVVDLNKTSDRELPIEPTAQCVSMSPDLGFVSYSDFSSTEELDENAGNSFFVCNVVEKGTIRVGRQCWESIGVWRPVGNLVAFLGWVDQESGLPQVILFNPRTEEMVVLASINSGDLSYEIAAPRVAWSPDGNLLAFCSYEDGGHALYISELDFGSCVKILQTDGLVHSLGFIRTGEA